MTTCRYLLGILAVLVTMGLAPAFAEDAEFSLDTWTKQTRYKSIEKTEYGGYEVRFSESTAKQHSGGWVVVVSYNNKSKTWVTVRTTVVHRTKGFAYPLALKDWCLEYNGKTAGAKFAYDPEFGDIDARWEIPVSVASSAIVDKAVMDVVNCADDNCDALLKLLTD